MDGRVGFKEAEKKRMLLSEETLLGLRMTGMSDYLWNFCRFYPIIKI